MNIPEAIELLGKEDRRSYPKRRLEAHIALKLGIEALKAWKKLREGRQGIYDPILPGETED